MSKRHAFKDMRHTLEIVEAQATMLLAAPGLDWERNEYALSMVMANMTHQTKNPTYTQMLTFLAAWLRFFKRLIERLPEDSLLRAQCQMDFDKLSENYQELLT